MNRHSNDRQDLLDIYAQHPLREETILARIARQRGTLEGITELDLAHDSLTEITDQNHVGGVASVVQLARHAVIGPTSRVLDIGSGLGGSARCLAYLYGCRVEGVELTPQRSAEALRLTARVRLDGLVTCTCGDILSVNLPAKQFDAVWGQGAWMHIADTAALFERIAGALAPGGCVVFEEAHLDKAPNSETEPRVLEELEHLWGGRFLSREAWQAALGGAGFEVTAVENLTSAFTAEFERLIAIARTDGAGHYPAHETEAFAHALTLAHSGVIGYSRFVARRG